MSNKDLVIEAVRRLPDEASLEEILEQIAILTAIRRGEEAAEAEKVVPQEEVKQLIAESMRRSASRGPWYTGEEVRGRLQALEEEWQRTGGFDESYMREFLKQLRAGAHA